VEKVVLAYSGGLDTSVILHWLLGKGYEVIAYIADVGQREDFGAVREKALNIGASKVYVEDLREEFVTDFIFPAIRGNAIYEGRYLLGTSLSRPLIARRQIEIAKKEGASIVSHGATGKGNDQVRFEFTYQVLSPGIKVLAPWKDEEFMSLFQGRSDLIRYAQDHAIAVKVTQEKPWSSDPNLMHASYEAGELEDPKTRPSDSMFEMSLSPKEAKDEESEIEIEFARGNPTRVRNLSAGVVKASPVELFEYLNQVGGQNGIGREDMVENRFVGIKSRGVYETPGGTILHRAHRDLEGITLDREVMHLRDSLVPKFSQLIYYGLWYSPEMEFLRAAFDSSQEHVTGKVHLVLYKGNTIIVGRESPESLYDQALASMDISGGYDAKDAAGFIRINALRLIASALREQRRRA
jgi:argininosuccinate synthase